MNAYKTLLHVILYVDVGKAALQRDSNTVRSLLWGSSNPPGCGAGHSPGGPVGQGGDQMDLRCLEPQSACGYNTYGLVLSFVGLRKQADN